MSPKNQQALQAYNFKVVLLGEGSVGKTSLVLRYVEDKFNPQHISTLQATFVTKRIALPNEERKALLNIWDTAGQERFHALGPIYYRGSHGAVLVYDITDVESFQKVKSWVRELKRMLGAEITIIIAGNKIDLESQRSVNYDEAIYYAHSVGAQYYETSAKQNEGVHELFESLTKAMVKRNVQREQETAGAMPLSQGVSDLRDSRAIIVGEDNYNDTDMTSNDDGALSNLTHRSCCGTG